MKQQKRRIEILRTMLERFDEGKSKSFYCLAVALLSMADLEEALSKAEPEINTDNSDMDDVKKRALILKKTLSSFADEEGVKLNLRKNRV